MDDEVRRTRMTPVRWAPRPAPDGMSLIVAETAAHRLNRYWLSGPRAGSRETLAGNLPGFPDNISLGSHGLIWVSSASPRNPLLGALLARPPWLRQVLWRVPDRLKPAPERTTWVLGVDLGGTIVHDLRRAGDTYSMVTGVAQRGGTLMLGSMHESAVAVTRIPHRPLSKEETWISPPVPARPI